MEIPPERGENIVPIGDYNLLPAAVGGRFLVRDLRPIVGCYGPRGIGWSHDRQLVPLRQDRS